MKNYIKINNQKIELTDEQVKEIQRSFQFGSVKLSDIPVGEIFNIGKYEFVVLEHSGDTTAVILKELLCEDEQFGSNNNYAESNVDKICNDFEDEFSSIIGADNLIEHTVDLTSDDGLKDYGTIKRRVSLLTTYLYRRYVKTIDKYKIDKWWWLATAHSTPKHENESWVKCVSPSGYIHILSCYDFNIGFRPFCILKSNIFVSK